MRFVGIAAMLITGLFCTSAWAGPALQKSPEVLLKILDRNGDGQISRNEWRKSMRLFDSIDSDNSGTATLEELRAYMGGGERRDSSLDKQQRAAVKWIDVHIHPNTGRGRKPDAKGAIEAAVAVMDADHISKMVLMPQPMIQIWKSGSNLLPPIPFERWINEARRHPGRFAVMGGGGSLNAMIHDESRDGHPSDELKRRFAARAEKIIELGAVGFGEIAISHLVMVPGQPFMDVLADHPLMLLLADIAAKHDAVIDVHFDLVLEDLPRPDYLPFDNPPVLKRNIDAFERFLKHNPKAKISWAHVGSDRLSFWTAKFTRQILGRHPNLYMSLRMFPSKSGLNHPLTDNGILKEWMQAFEEFPDRFFIGGDQFFLSPALRNNGGPGAKFAQMTQDTRDRVNRFLAYLPPEIARKFAYENAARVYKLSESDRLRGLRE